MKKGMIWKIGGTALVAAVMTAVGWGLLQGGAGFSPEVSRTALGAGLLGSGLTTFVYLLAGILFRKARMEREARALEKKNAQIRALNEQLLRMGHHQRLELLGTLTSSIAHEFNNLLTPIMGYSLMALEKLPEGEEELYDNLLEVYNASKEAKNIISRLNDLSRKQSENTFHMVSLDEIVGRTVKVALPAKPTNVEIRQSLNCWGQRIRANELQLSQLLLNLILNGFQAMGDGGVLTLETSFDENWAYLCVRDTGCGIPEENRKKIFEPFFTTREKTKGTGLGLPMVLQTLEDHGGKLDLKSEVGKGTTFLVQLPRNEGKET